MAETLADLYREVGLNFRSPAVRTAEQTPYTPSTPLRRPTPGPSAREAQRRMLLGAPRDIAQAGRNYQQNYVSQLRDGRLPDAVRDLPGQAVELTGLPSFRRAGRAAASGDLPTAALETGMGALGVVGMGAALRPAVAMADRAATMLPTGFRTQAHHIVDVNRTPAVRPGRYGQAVHFDLDPAITTHLGDFGTTKAARFDYDLRGNFATPEQFRTASEALGSPEAAQRALRQQGFAGVRDNEYVALWDSQNAGRARSVGPLPPMSTRRRASDPLLGAARAPAEAAVSTEATRVPFPRIRDGTTWVRPEADYAAAHEGLRPQFGSERLYHGTSADVQGPLRPSKRSGFPEPTGVSLAHSPETAGQFGNAIYPVNTRGSIGDAEAFMRRARALMSEGMPETQASAQAQREFQNAGYTGVRWGNRETTMFNSEDMRPAIGTPAESPQRIPRAIQPQTRASDGTILPAQPRETFGRPFSRTAGTSDDLREAALPREPLRGGTPEALQRAREQGFDVDTPLYRGLSRPYDESKAGYYQMLTTSPADASEYAGYFPGANVVPAFVRRGRNITVDGRHAYFNSVPIETLPQDIRARLHPSVGETARTDEIAHAAREAGYDSATIKNIIDPPTSMGARGNSAPPATVEAVFDPRNIRSRFAAFDPARSGESDLLASVGAPVAAAALFGSRKRRK